MKRAMTIAAWVLVVLALPEAEVFAVDFNAEARAGVGVSDNLLRSAQNEIDDTITTVGFSLGVVEQGRNLDLTIQSQFDYLDYSDSAFDAEWVGGLNGNATLTLIDERLSWIFQDNFGQQLFNPLQPSRPGNREDVNVFTTGPTINFFNGRRNSVRVDLRYSRRSFEIQPNDNDRLSSTISIGRDVSRQSNTSFNVSATRAEFDNSDFSPPIESYQAFVRYERNGNLNTLSVDVGYNEVEFAGINANGLLFGMAWSHTTSANGVLSVSGRSQFSDRGDIFTSLRNISTNLGNASDVLDNNAAFLSNSLNVAYVLQNTRYSIDASGNWSQQDFPSGQAGDRDVYGGRLNLQREISRTVFAGANIFFQSRDFRSLNRRDDDLSLGLDVGYRITPGLSVSLLYLHFQRSSTVLNADFTENRAFVRFAYTPVWSR